VDFQRHYERLKKLIDARLAQRARGKGPRSVYDPIEYVLTAGGKRIRPVLTLLACESVGGTSHRALNAAVAVEMLHNFTLVHDDIMDSATTRRGRETVHRKWDNNVAILAGDQLVALAYQTLLQSEGNRTTEMVETFTAAFREVCEGQGLDEELESRNDVTIRDYLQMIDKKTAAMIAGATRIGGIVGGGSSKEIKALYTYGRYLGRAFQIQDDLLDVTADYRSFGKTIGGDLQEGKKTYLLLRARERSTGNDRKLLLKVVGKQNLRWRDIVAIRTIFERYDVIKDARILVRKTTLSAQRALGVLRPGRAKAMLAWLADRLLERVI
jgi:geranylgeranyl diphosphate synthase type II